MGKLGDTITFNGTDIYTAYSADLIEKKPLYGVVSSVYRKNAGLCGYKLYDSDIPLKNLEMAFYVEGANAAGCEENVSKFIAHAKSTVIGHPASGFEYPAILLSYTDEDTKVDFYHKVTMKFGAIKRKPKVTTTLTSSGTITNTGTAKTGLKLSFTASSSHSDLHFAGAVFDAVAGHTYVIDGIDGAFTDNGDNCLGDVVMYQWPELDVGSNSITIPTGETVTAEYYPVFE